MQNGIRHLRKVKIWYRPDVNTFDVAYGGMKAFVDTQLEDFKAKNPQVDVEVETVDDPEQALGDPRFPRMTGYYLNGTAQTHFCEKYSPEAINITLHNMRNTLNDCPDRPHQMAVLHTDLPSVQGTWSPYLWLKDRPLTENELLEQAATTPDDAWKDEIKDIARYVRAKKEKREEEFTRRHYIASATKKKMESRWENEVFPYTVGTDTAAVPGRLFLEETRTIFPEAGGTPPQSAQEGGGGGFMGGFVSPYGRSESSVLGTSEGSLGSDKYSVSQSQRGGNVPPFAGAPFTSGYGDYENFWSNWDLFHSSSQTYRPPPTAIPPQGIAEERRLMKEKAAQRMQRGREDNWAKES
eukprot:Rhum_TRINITY_DN3102_c0_g1::Rhum_TRINITY_DN3102_c0_g1_i1::g.9646::m.9646